MFIAKKTDRHKLLVSGELYEFFTESVGFLIIIMILHEELFQMGFRPHLVHC